MAPYRSYTESFNSRPHKEVDPARRQLMTATDLSIHDLTRRSTWAADITRHPYNLSIHDLTRRSTVLLACGAGKEPLSIHALTRRSTPGHRHTHLHANLSIHDLTRRSTQTRPITKPCSVFQFTTSQGGRPTSFLAFIARRSFNSRPHKEVDLLYCHVTSSSQHFQFTTSQGGRLSSQSFLRSASDFQFTTSQGGRRTP